MTRTSGLGLLVPVVAWLTALSTPSPPAWAAGSGCEFVAVQGGMGWTTTLPDGRLMAWWTDGKSESDPASINNTEIVQKAWARYSSDSGITWSEPQVLLGFPRGKGAYEGLNPFVDRDNAIHLFGLHFFSYDLKNYDNWDAYECYAFHVMSPDGGKTWTAPQHCGFGAYKYAGMTNAAVQTRSGRLILPLSCYSKRKTGRFVIVCSLSDDGGRAWRVSKGEIAVDTGGAQLESGACEPVVIELKDGRVWMMIRTQAGSQFEAFSSDGGDTWTEPRPTRFISSNSCGALLRLRDGRIVFVWQNTLSGREVLCAAITDDEGKTWHGYREVTGHAHYPFLTEAPDGAIVLQCLGAAGVTRIRPDWLLQTSVRETFAGGIANWSTEGTEGVSAIARPDQQGKQVLALRKTAFDKPAGASFNFPFGAKGELAVKLRLQAGAQGARLCLTDYFTKPSIPEDGRFGVKVDADGTLCVGTRGGQFTPTQTKLTPGKWHSLAFVWDCGEGACSVSVDGAHAVDLKQIWPAPGVCYLRLLSAAEQVDEAGLLVESVATRATAW